MAVPCGAVDHSYFRNKSEDRCSSVFRLDGDHTYTYTTPKKSCKRPRGTPTGKTPQQQVKSSKVVHGLKSQTPWSDEEKEFFRSYVKNTPRGNETLVSYWKACADVMNTKYPDHCRNGIACKSLSQRLFIVPDKADEICTCTSVEQESLMLGNFVDTGTQTDLCLPVNYDRNEHKAGEWLHMEPKKNLEENASKGAEELHQSALKRLRQYPHLDSSSKSYLIDLLCLGSAQQFARGLMTTSFGDEVIKQIINDIEMDARECANRGSVLCQKNYADLKNFQWDNIVNELVSKNTLLSQVLLAVALPTSKIGNTKFTETLCPVISTVYGILMKQRFKDLCAVQKFVTASLANEHTHEKVYDRLQRLGVSLSHSGMLDQMSGISGSFNEELINAVLEGKRFRIVGDNVNFHIDVAQERSVGKKAHIEHWFGSAAIIQNVSFNHLPNVTPQKDLREIACESFILTTDEMNLIVQDFTMHSAKILTEHFNWLEFAKPAVTETIDELPEGMDQRNKVIPLPVLHKNEQKYADVVEVLDSYQDICETVYRSAEKPLSKVHIGGDQLTRERFSGAKKLRAAGLTESERLANLQPITFELFHLQMAVLTAFYQILYDTQNTEPFTLYCQKVRLMRKQADGKDVKNHYDSCKDLAESFIKAYIVEAACEHIGLPDTTVVPDNIPDHSNMSSEEIRVWVSEQFTPIFDNVTSVTREFLNGAGIQQNITDSINTYANLVVELGLIYMELCNIVKRPNRDRLLRLMKYIMLVLKGHNNRSKYALEILRLLCQQFALLSEQCAHETIYGLFVNTGKSVIPADLQMEYLVRLTKTHLRAMCSNVTETSLKKRSSAFFGMNEISEHFDIETSTVKRAQKHKKLSSLEDEKKILRCLRVIRPFVTVTGRKIKSQKKNPKNPIAKLNIEDLKGWLEKHKVNFYYEL